MLSEEFKTYISELLGSEITKVQSISGGSISSTYLLQSHEDNFFLKTNHGREALNMFTAEKKGLELISKTQTINTPEILACGSFQKEAFILMKFIESKKPTAKDYKIFGNQLAKLHETSLDDYGLDDNNYIGSLKQLNNFNKSWKDFYVEERLMPQLNLARLNGLLINNDIPDESHLKNVCHAYFTNIKPALLHGDLWHGNFLIAKDGLPYLIDPAVYYGHREVDIAMSLLFGGFSPAFYNSYFENYPKDDDFEIRIELYQLYYLLVHLNLFGASYYPSVKHIIEKYF